MSSNLAKYIQLGIHTLACWAFGSKPLADKIYIIKDLGMNITKVRKVVFYWSYNKSKKRTCYSRLLNKRSCESMSLQYFTIYYASILML